MAVCGGVIVDDASAAARGARGACGVRATTTTTRARVDDDDNAEFCADASVGAACVGVSADACADAGADAGADLLADVRMEQHEKPRVPTKVCSYDRDITNDIIIPPPAPRRHHRLPFSSLTSGRARAHVST